MVVEGEDAMDIELAWWAKDLAWSPASGANLLHISRQAPHCSPHHKMRDTRAAPSRHSPRESFLLTHARSHSEPPNSHPQERY